MAQQIFLCICLSNLISLFKTNGIIQLHWSNNQTALMAKESTF